MLTPAQAVIWERYYRQGRTDGRGHMTTPSVVLQKPPSPTLRGPKLEAGSPEPGKPSFETAFAAKRGDRTARQEIQRYAAHLEAKREGEAQAERLTSAQFGGVEQLAAQANKVVRPSAGAVIEALSPYTAGKEAVSAARRGEVGPAAIAALGVFPFGRGPRLAAKAARAGKKAGKPLSAEQEVLRATGAARRTYAEQEKLRSAERARRITKAGAAFEAAGGGEAGVLAKLGALKGELPQIRFDKLTHLDDHTMKRLIDGVEVHPDLREFEKLALQNALRRTRAGMVPRPFEIKLVERVFGPEKAAELTAPFGRKVLHAAAEIANVPRSILASADVSAPFRQALLASAHNPRVFAKNLGPMFRYLVSEKNYVRVMRGIEEDPLYGQMLDDGIRFTGLGDVAGREEQFMSSLAETITGGRYSFVRASSRAYTGFLNKLRADLYKSLVDDAHAVGKWSGPQTGRDIARFVNVATGRGGLGPLERAAVPLNTVFFAPRLVSSRFQALNPVFYASLDPFVRKRAVLAMAKLIGAGTTVLILARLNGARVNTDPRNADFGKLRIGNTRIDIWGGHQQFVRLFSQLASGQIVSSTTGKTLRLKGGYSLSREDVAERFIKGKFAPTPALIREWFKGTDFQDRPFSWKRGVVERSYPLLIQDMLDVYHETGSPWKAAAGYGIGAFGIGVQTYGPKPKKSQLEKQLNIEEQIDKAFQQKSIEEQIDEAFQRATP